MELISFGRKYKGILLSSSGTSFGGQWLDVSTFDSQFLPTVSLFAKGKLYTQWDDIVSILERGIDSCSDQLSAGDENHLPFFLK